jgi:lipid II:glycine glycyltransferase (peptidoglycan interpeptide bridge formation enzyme)
MIDIRQTPKYAKYLRKTGWQVVQLNHINCFIRNIPVVGPIIKVQRPETIPLKKIEQLAKTHRAFQVIIEPKNKLDAKFLTINKYKKSKKPFLPTKTLHLDLTKTKEELTKGLKKDARLAIRKNNEVSVSDLQLNNIRKFRIAWKNAVGKKRYVPPLLHLEALKKTFADKALFLITKNHSAGAIFLIEDKLAYYWQAFSNKEGRKSLAQYKIIWEGILKSKAVGVKILDFEGIYDERFPDKSWRGFSHFKKSFGGHEIEYPGIFSKIYLLEMFKKIATIIAILVLLALDWAALDDITTGNEPDYSGEYFVLVASVLVFGLLIFLYIKKWKKSKKS